MTIDPRIIEVDASGQLALPQWLLSPADLHEGDQVLVLLPGPGLIYLCKVDASEQLSREELSELMRTAFESSGYTTRGQVLTLVREARCEQAQEW
jgi:antitoxin component of MazEF toxin-antitoxin module